VTKISGDVALGELRTLFAVGTYGSLTDGELLEQFAHRREEAGAPAFGALVDRHGRMVLRVCRGALRDPNDVEDAFQATFLVLARKARSLWVRESIGPWLFGVAVRVAARAQSDSLRRRRHERRAAQRAETCGTVAEYDDLTSVLHEEIDRLPARLRAPLVLCYLAEMSQEQAARQLGCPLGTVRSRLARGRDRLRVQLNRRGVAPALALPVFERAARLPSGGLAVRPVLSAMTTQAATRFAAGGAGAARVDPAALTLTRGVLRTMILSKLCKVAAVLLVAALAATGTVSFAWQEDPRSLTSARRGNSSPELTLASAVAPPEAVPASNASEAEQIANRILKVGSDLFDAKNAAALAATYTEEGQIHIISKPEDQPYKDDIKRGRGEIEQFYNDLFKDAGPIDSENTLEFARLIAPDLLVIHGRFRPNTGQSELPFVQMRVKQGPDWQLKELWLFLSPGGGG
jgi:RNA polymerase sigma factor (sigma-70 family)